MSAPTTRPHQVLLHGTRDGLATGIASFLSVSLLRGEAAVLIATPEHLSAAASALITAGVDLDGARAEHRYLELDAAETLAGFRSTSGIDEARFDAVVRSVLDDLAKTFGAAASYGEMVGLLAAEGDVVGAIQREQLWGPVTRSIPMRLLCGYPHERFDGSAPGLDMVHDLHDTTARTTDATWALDLPAGPEAASIARGAIAQLCAMWGLGTIAWSDDVVLVVAELVGNAIRQGGSRPTLSVDVHGDEVTLSVTDGSEALPAPRGGSLDENGRGYVNIDALADAWGVERLPFGKRVWARFVLA